MVWGLPNYWIEQAGRESFSLSASCRNEQFETRCGSNLPNDLQHCHEASRNPRQSGANRDEPDGLAFELIEPVHEALSCALSARCCLPRPGQ